MQDPAAGAGRSFGGLVRVPSLRSIGGKSRAPSLSPGPPHPRARPQLVPTPDIVPATEAWVSRGWTQEDGAGTEDMARPQPRERASGKEVVDWTTDTEVGAAWPVSGLRGPGRSRPLRRRLCTPIGRRAGRETRRTLASRGGTCW